MKHSTDTAERHLTTAVADSRLDQTVRQFHADGFGVVRGMFTADETAALDAEATRLLQRTDLMQSHNLRCRWQTDITSGACVFDAFDPVIDLSPLCAELATDRRIAHLLQAVYGEPGRLFKDKLIYKPPGASGYALHQDFISWPIFPRSFISVVVAIDTCDATSGCIEVFPGCHRQGSLTAEDGNYHEIPPGTIDDIPGVKLQLAPGDVAFFSAFTPHRSAPNRSRHWRRQLYLSYNAVSDGGDRRDEHYQFFRGWLRERYAEYGVHEVTFL